VSDARSARSVHDPPPIYEGASGSAGFIGLSAVRCSYIDMYPHVTPTPPMVTILEEPVSRPQVGLRADIIDGRPVLADVRVNYKGQLVWSIRPLQGDLLCPSGLRRRLHVGLRSALSGSSAYPDREPAVNRLSIWPQFIRGSSADALSPHTIGVLQRWVRE